MTSPAAGSALRIAPAAAAPALRPSLREPQPLEDGALRRETGVFGSVPIPVAQIGLSPRFAQVRDGDPPGPFRACLADETRCAGDLHRRLRAIAAMARGQSEGQGEGEGEGAVLRAVNRAVNAAVRYQTDAVTWGVEDYWASPAETLARGAGDCEDYALLKMAMLAALGVADSRMTVVVVKDTVRGIGHAVLAVRVGERFAILDNLTDAVRGDGEIASYLPLYSIGPTGAWLHGRRREAPALQVSSSGRAAPDGLLRGTLN